MAGKGDIQHRDDVQATNLEDLYSTVADFYSSAQSGMCKDISPFNSAPCLSRDTSPEITRPSCNNTNISWALSPMSISSLEGLSSPPQGRGKIGTSACQNPALSIPPSTHSDYLSSTPIHGASQHQPQYNYGGSNIQEWQQVYQWYCSTNFTRSPWEKAERDAQTGTENADNINSGSFQTENDLTNICSSADNSSDFMRCSTPEVMMALATLQQSCDKPVKLEQSSNQANKLDGSNNSSLILSDPKSWTPVWANPKHGQAYSHTETPLSTVYSPNLYKPHDSGYGSDLSASPAFSYTAARRTASGKIDVVEKQLSPPSYLHSENKENVPETARNAEHITMMGYMSQRTKISNPLESRDPKSNSATFNKQGSGKWGTYTPQMWDRQIQSSDITSSNVYPRQFDNQELTPKPVAKLPLEALKSALNTPENHLANRHPPVKRGAHELGDTRSNDAKKRRHNEPLSLHSVEIMTSWYLNHRDNPYPTKPEKEMLAKQGGVSVTQVKSWFANKRNRNNNTRPKVQKIKMQEKLLDICHQLARDAKQPSMDNAFLIQQLSSIIDTSAPPTS